MNKDKLNELFDMRPEWLNTQRSGVIESAYAEGWNNCNKVWLANLSALRKEVDRDSREGGMDNLAVPVKVVLQNIDDMPTIVTINKSVLSESLRDEKLAPVTWGDDYDSDGNEVIESWECPGCGVCYDIDEDYDYCPSCGQHIDWSGIYE